MRIGPLQLRGSQPELVSVSIEAEHAKKATPRFFQQSNRSGRLHRAAGYRVCLAHLGFSSVYLVLFRLQPSKIRSHMPPEMFFEVALIGVVLAAAWFFSTRR